MTFEACDTVAAGRSWEAGKASEEHGLRRVGDLPTGETTCEAGPVHDSLIVPVEPEAIADLRVCPPPSRAEREAAVRAAINAGATSWRAVGDAAGMSHENARQIGRRLGLKPAPRPARKSMPRPRKSRRERRRGSRPWHDEDVHAKFMTSVVVADDPLAVAPWLGPCWFWTGPIDVQGYGHFYWDYRSMYAHRYAYRYFRGPINQTLDHLCHSYCTRCAGGPKCRHRSCVAPDHLEDVSLGENGRRGFPNVLVPHGGKRSAHAVSPVCPNGHRWSELTTLYDARGRRVCSDCRDGFYYPPPGVY